MDVASEVEEQFRPFKEAVAVSALWLKESLSDDLSISKSEPEVASLSCQMSPQSSVTIDCCCFSVLCKKYSNCCPHTAKSFRTDQLNCFQLKSFSSIPHWINETEELWSELRPHDSVAIHMHQIMVDGLMLIK